MRQCARCEGQLAGSLYTGFGPDCQAALRVKALDGSQPSHGLVLQEDFIGLLNRKLDVHNAKKDSFHWLHGSYQSAVHLIGTQVSTQHAFSVQQTMRAILWRLSGEHLKRLLHRQDHNFHKKIKKKKKKKLLLCPSWQQPPPSNHLPAAWHHCTQVLWALRRPTQSACCRAQVRNECRRARLTTVDSRITYCSPHKKGSKRNTFRYFSLLHLPTASSSSIIPPSSWLSIWTVTHCLNQQQPQLLILKDDTILEWFSLIPLCTANLCVITVSSPTCPTVASSSVSGDTEHSVS